MAEGNEPRPNFDTGWTDLNTTYPTYYRVINGIVFILMRLNGGAIPEPETVLGTMPSQYKPWRDISVPSQNLRCSLSVSRASGDVIISKQYTVSGIDFNAYMSALISYPI